ncbi:hypothetical protein [Cryobacterium sp. 10I5]|uniref:hypothetical protein n=1 Tax=Cryobacterium sp. 10I5 TaxID=3048581 RepID=UPI002B22B9AC|nr:hypothetical protein [Cryobacterium sp. 10I5]MEB0265904.1 hypothetical protein [Cryobacterium sp. 10I5]
MSQEHAYIALLWEENAVKPDRFEYLTVGGQFQPRVERHIRPEGQSLVEVWQLRTPNAAVPPAQPDYDRVETVGVDSRLLSPQLLRSSFRLSHPDVDSHIPIIIARDRDDLRRRWDARAGEYGSYSMDEMTITEVLH